MNLITKLIKITDKHFNNKDIFLNIPELQYLNTNIELNNWHNEETTLEHTVSVLHNFIDIVSFDDKLKNYMERNIGSYSRNNLFKLSIIFHDIAKPNTLTIKNGKTLFPNHERISAIKANILFRKFKLLNMIEIRYVLQIISKHGDVHKFFDIKKPYKNAYIGFYKQFKKLSLEMALIGYVDTLNSYLAISNKCDYNYRVAFLKKFITLFLNSKF